MQLHIQDNIDSNHFIDFLNGLSQDFTYNFNGDLGRIAIYWREKFIGGIPKGRLPRHDEYNYKGSVVRRGYQHMLGRIFTMCKKDDIWISYEHRRRLVKALETLNYWKDAVDYWNHESDEHKHIEEIKQNLYRNHGVTVGQYLPKELS